MRKLSCKWPMWFTLFAFLPPGFYMWYRIKNPEIFNTTELANKVVGGLGLAIITWLVYGVACLLAQKPKKAIEGRQNDTPKDEEEE